MDFCCNSEQTSSCLCLPAQLSGLCQHTVVTVSRLLYNTCDCLSYSFLEVTSPRAVWHVNQHTMQRNVHSTRDHRSAWRRRARSQPKTLHQSNQNQARNNSTVTRMEEQRHHGYLPSILRSVIKRILRILARYGTTTPEPKHSADTEYRAAMVEILSNQPRSTPPVEYTTSARLCYTP